MRSVCALAVVATLTIACGSDGNRVAHRGALTARVLTATVVATRPHRLDAFTEGLVFAGRSRLMESVGLYGSSALRELDPDTGTVRRSSVLPADVFAEGLGVADGRLVQLTWKEGRAFVWDESTLEPAPGFTYRGEGWGLSYDSTHTRWVQSDGSSTLTFRDPSTFRVTGHLDVRRDGRPLRNLNELEVVGSHVWANVWHSNDLVRIDLRDGVVSAVVDLAALVPDGLSDPDDVLNGIAHRPGDPVGRLWVTGKRWPRIFEIEVS